MLLAPVRQQPGKGGIETVSARTAVESTLHCMPKGGYTDTHVSTGPTLHSLHAVHWLRLPSRHAQHMNGQQHHVPVFEFPRSDYMT